ncbi:hypothetical protein VTN96DRAFT_4002 [Rasamsonia emersonii]
MSHPRLAEPAHQHHHISRAEAAGHHRAGLLIGPNGWKSAQAPLADPPTGLAMTKNLLSRRFHSQRSDAVPRHDSRRHQTVVATSGNPVAA